MPAPKFFKTHRAFRSWFEKNAGTSPELLVGFHKLGTGRPSMSWSESVDEALCYGWIDGLRKRIDDYSYSIRFTPRRSTSIWSAINIAKFEKLRADGRMTATGAAAFGLRRADKPTIYSHEQENVAELSASELRMFKRNKAAWTFFEQTPRGYKRRMLHRVAAPKRPATRASRLSTLVKASAAGERLR